MTVLAKHQNCKIMYKLFHIAIQVSNLSNIYVTVSLLRKHTVRSSFLQTVISGSVCYCNFLKYSASKIFVVITLKFELGGSTIE